MDSGKIASWIQITATVGVLVGIILVVIELRQAKAIAHANITAQFFSEIGQNNRVQMGENPAAVLSKACLSPSEITNEDLFVLEGYFVSRWALADRSYRLELVGEFGTPWEAVARKSLQPIVRLEHGRKWLTQNVSAYNPGLSEVVSRLLEDTKDVPCEVSLSGLE